MMKRFAALFFVVAVAACAGETRAPDSPQAKIVSDYVAAFNDRDIEAMEAKMHADIEWLSVKGDMVSVDTKGREDMVAGLKGYLSSMPSVTSHLEGWSVNGNFVGVTEVVSWRTKAGDAKSQASLSVYELEGGLIRRVWYYPEQPR